MLLHSSPLLNVAAWVVASSVKGAVLIAVVIILRRLLGAGASSAWRYALWLPVLACLVCPLRASVPVATTFRSSLPARIAVPPASAKMEATPTGTHGTPHPRSDRSAALMPPPPVSPSFTAQNAARSTLGTPLGALLSRLMLIWTVGVAVLTSLYVSNLLKFRRLRLAARTLSGTAGSVFEGCKAELRVRRTVRLLESNAIESPTVVGWWRPTLLLPLGLHERLDNARLRHVLLHELAHVKRNDILVNWIAALAQLIHWFNPAVWIGARLMRADMESAADAYVLCHLSRRERGEYGDTLVHLADSNGGRISLPYGLGIADRHADLKGRLLMIKRFRPASIPVKLAVGLALATFTCVALTRPSLSPPSGISPDAAHPVDLNTGNVRGSLPAGRARAAGVPIEELIKQVAANIHKRVLVDPRVDSTVILYGQKLDQITYPDFLTILRINDLTAVQINNYINVVSLAHVRQLPLPTFTQGLPDDQFATMSVELKNSCAPRLVPMLRPLLPVYAELSADNGSNTLLAIDTSANLKRLRSIIAGLDDKTKPGPRCGDASETQAPVIRPQ